MDIFRGIVEVDVMGEGSPWCERFTISEAIHIWGGEAELFRILVEGSDGVHLFKGYDVKGKNISLYLQ